MAEHPDFTLSIPAFSIQSLEIRNDAGDIVRLLCDNIHDRTVLAGALESCLVLFEVIKKKGN